MFEDLSWVSSESYNRLAVFSLYILPFCLFLLWVSGKQWLIFLLLVLLPFPTMLRDHCQRPFTLVSSLFWDVICLGQEPWIYLEQLRFTFTINSPILGFNSLMSVCTTCFSLTITLLDGREGREKLPSFVFCLPPNPICMLIPCSLFYCPSKHSFLKHLP